MANKQTDLWLEWKDVAKSHGIHCSLFWQRVKVLKWSAKKAATQEPKSCVRSARDKTFSQSWRKWRDVAQKNGVTSRVFQQRVKMYGWKEKDAATTKINGRSKRAIYAIYKGEDLLFTGTVEQCAEELGVKPRTIKFYVTQTYKKRISDNGRAVYRID